MRRVPVFVALTVASVLIPAAPASAHTVGGAGATNFKSRLVSVTPAVAGLMVGVVENGRRVQVSNSGPVDVIVLGYFGEPYLRVGPGGVFENVASPSVALNGPEATASTLPSGGSVAASAPPPPLGPPRWRRASAGHRVLWHDHRTHWAGPVPTALVAHAPAAGLVLRQWTVNLVSGDQPVQVKGTLAYVPGPSPWPWLALAGALAVVTLVAVGTGRWATGLGLALTVLVVTDVVHATGIGFASAGSTTRRLALVLSGSYFSMIAWVVGLLAIHLLRRRSLDGVFAAVFAALVIGVWSGIADFTVLSRSQLPFAGPAVVERLVVATALGLGVGVVAGGWVAFHRAGAEVPVGAS